MSKKHIIKSAGIIGFATVISRLFGFLRDILIAGFFGTRMYAQAFVVAFRIPNMLRDLIGEGATNAAFVPVLSEYLETKKREEFWHLANVLLNVILIVLSVVSLLGIFLSPVIVRFMAPGFISDSEKFRVTVQLTRLMFPYVLLVGLFAYSMGILNSLKHFSMPAFAPAILNISIILCAVLKQGSVTALAEGVLIGGVIQLVVQIPVLAAKGFVPFQKGLYHPAVKKIGVLLVPRILGSCVYQISIFINTMLASLSNIVGEGGVAALYYANRIFQFPLAIFGIAVAQAALPTMSRQALEAGLDRLKATLSFSLRAVNFIMIPSSLGLIVLARPITSALFERGMFDNYSTVITAQALLFYSIGRFSYAGIKILVSCFYSLKDTFTPVKIASVSLILNILLNVIFIFPLKVSGLALATSFSAAFNFFSLFFVLRKKIGSLGGYEILNSFIRVLAAGLAMAALIYFCAFKINMNLFLVISIGIIAYPVFTFIFDVKETKDFLKWALRRN